MRATELTLKQELAPIIGHELKLEYTTETSVFKKERNQIDVTYLLDDQRIILELEIGGRRKLLEGIRQADRYREALRATGTVTIAYPEQARAEVERREDVLRLLHDLPFEALVLTPFQRKYYPSVKLDLFVSQLRDAISRPQPTDLDTLLGVLRECVEDISFQTKRRTIRSSIANEVVSQFELFSILAGPEEGVKAETLESAAADLASYIIVNQILLYFLLSRTLDLPGLREVETLNELEASFKRITKKDYRAVYKIDIVRRLPKQAIGSVNRIITAFRNLRPEAVQHDLLGRMFHEFLPLRTRKLFATFYTKPVAAEILGSLATESVPETVLEPAAGSGTLLVAVYKALRTKNSSLTHEETLARLYAIDIMPFAAHLSALNLTLQDLSSSTEKVNVGIGNSLNIKPSAKYPTQTGLFDQHITRRANAQESLDEELQLPRAVDLVIMNPPFTDSRRLMPSMLASREKAFSEKQNYWAYFLSLANDMLKPSGRIAAVLPRLFFSGSKSREVRDWLFSECNYSLLYVVRTTREFAFSEAASFRDFLVVLEKTKEGVPLPPCRIIYLNRSLSNLELEGIPSLVRDLREVPLGRDVCRTADYSAFEVSQQRIRRNTENLWPLVGFEYPENSAVVSDFLDKLRQYAGGHLTSFSRYLEIEPREANLGKVIPRGFEPKPKGLYSAIYVTRSRKGRRDEPNTLHLLKDGRSSLLVELKGQHIEIPKTSVIPAVYSASYIRTFDIDRANCDYVIFRPGSFSKSLQDLSGVRVDYNYVSKSTEKCQSNILIAKRLNIVAPGTTHLAFYNRDLMVSPNTLYSVRCSANQALMLTTWMNSIFGILQLLQYRKETEGGYCDLLKEDLASFLVPDIDSPPKTVLSWFEKSKEAIFPPLALQFGESSQRVELDKAWMNWLGWPAKELESDLRSIHIAASKEFQAISSASKIDKKM